MGGPDIRHRTQLPVSLLGLNTMLNACLKIAGAPWFRARSAIVLLSLFAALTAPAQITITNGVQTYGALAGVTVNMSGACELRVTNTTTPILGCTINLTGPDAWLFLTGIKPSAVASGYMGQIRINGTGAVVDVNCRVVQYGLSGAVIIPHASTFQPLQVFSEPNFTGTSASYGQYVYYTGTGLGVMDQNISSFKLKRGYMAVLAQQTSGNGYSKCYIAQDGDLDIGALPAALDDQVRFIYITPWRWVAKKGIAGDPGISQLNVSSWYNWNIDQNSTRDLEYTAIRQTRWWPSLSQNWKTRGINTVLGYNEPDSSSQANIAVGDAIWSWPDLLGTGLRVGSPATTDGGYSSWLYPFMSQADAANLRVDFVAVHYYRCASQNNPTTAASQMYNALKAIYDTTKRPIWVTEWNNGANWTGCGDPDYTQQQQCIEAMINMLEDAPFVERYQLYSWVEEVRQVTTNGVLTPAGVTYRDKASKLSYRQTMPDNGTRSVAQFLFETNALDSSGQGNNGLQAGAPSYAPGQHGQAVVLDGMNSYVQLPANVARSNAFTFAAWVKWDGGANWQRLFDFGNDTSHYLFLTPNNGSVMRFAINNGGGEQIISAPALPVGQWQHVAITLSGGAATLYTNGVQAAAAGGFSITPSNFKPEFNYLGRSQFANDPLFAGSLDDVQIADYAFSASQVAGLLTNTPPSFATNLLVRPAATDSQSYSNSIAGTATDPDGDPLTYGKAGGPAWLTVAPDGTLGGTPGPVDYGANSFTVTATDLGGMSAFATLTIYVNTGSNILARYDFEGSTQSSVNTADGILTGPGAYVDGHSGQAIDLDGSANFITLPAGFGSAEGMTFAAWVNWDGGLGWQRIFDFGNGTGQYLFLTPNSGDGTLRFAIKNGGNEEKVDAPPLPTGQWRHVAFTLSGSTGKLFVNGVPVAVSNNITITPASFNPAINLLGDSQFVSDPLYNGRLDEVVIANYGMSDAQVALLYTNHPPQFTSSSITRADASEGQSYTNTIAGTATDTDSDETLTYRKVSGPAWLLVAKDGTLTGIPSPADVGTNTFTVGVNDFAGAPGTATLLINVQDQPNPVVTLTADDALGTTSFYTAGNWDSGAAPNLYSDYFTSSYLLRTPDGTSDYTFAGNSLTLEPNGGAGGSLIFKGAGTRTYTIPMLYLSGGLIRSGSGSSDVCILDGNLSMNNETTTTIQADQGAFVLAGPIAGGGHLKTRGGYSTTLSGKNTYEGDTLVEQNTLRVNAGPVVYMSFNSVSGANVINQGTGGSYMNGTLTGAGATIVGGGRYGNALSINGTSAYVLITNKVTSLDCGTGGGAWTYALWLKTSTAGAKYGYQGNGGWNASAQTTFYLNANSTAAGGTKAGGVRWGDSWLTGSATINDNQWHFIAITVSGGYKKIYVDGNLDSQTGTTGWTAAGSGTANQFWIGGSPNTGDGTANLSGLIDEVYIYSRALSQGEVQSLMNTPNGSVAGLDRTLSPSSLVNISSGAKLDLNGSVQTVLGVIGSGTVDTTVAGGTATLVVSNNSDYTFDGTLANTGGALALTKTGAGKFTLAAASNNHTGATKVEAGTLVVNGLLPSSVVTVNGSGVLGGTGAIASAVTVQSGGSIAPGNGSGRLTVSNNVTLQAGSFAAMEIDKGSQTNDVLRVTGTLSYGGTLLVSSLGGTLAEGDSFPLFSATAHAGSFAATILPVLTPGLGWEFDHNSGVLSVVQTVAANPTNLTYAVSNNVLTLSWPLDHTGWRLETQTNSLSGNWFTVPGSSGANIVVLPVGSEAPISIFFRLVYP